MKETEPSIQHAAYKGLKDFFEERYKLQEEEWELIRESFVFLKASKGTHLLETDQVCGFLYYLHQGLARFYQWVDGEEKTQYFAFEDYFFTQQESFFLHRPSKVCIQLLEDSTLLSIDREKLGVLRVQSPAWARFALEIRTEVQVATESLLQDFKSLTAKERYLDILEDQPEIIQRVPLKYLASFLGITPESLSRIRKIV